MKRQKGLFILSLLLMGVGPLTLAQDVASKISCAKAAPMIQMKTGSVCGLKQQSSGEEAYAYLGIPYAKPPTGALRWQPPAKVEDWKPKIYPAVKIASECPQPSPTSSTGYSGSEDCLYLNVWKPTKTHSKRLPVMVFIPGGGFLTGQGGYPAYNGTYMAGIGQVIVVTMNYRLGALGFLRYQKNKSQIDGNFALLDQLEALKWVNQNIERFGGDPNQVTIFGESAGAMSVGTHLFAMPASNPYFRAAIMESNVLSITYDSPQKTEAKQEKFISKLCELSQLSEDKCPKTAQWLRSLSLNVVMSAENELAPNGGVSGLLLLGMTKGFLWQPISGVYPVVGPMNKGFQPGTEPKPFVIGTNRNEGAFFVPHANQFSTNDYEKLLVRNFGSAKAKEILSFKVNGNRPYNPSDYPNKKDSLMTSAAQAMAKVITDYAFTGASIFAVSEAWKQMKANNLPVFGYRFTQHSTFNYAIYERCGPLSDNICHTEEIPYVFHNFIERQGTTQSLLPESKVTDAERQLSQKMVRAWVGFAKNPTNWKKGFGYPPLESASLGPYVNWRDPVQPIEQLAELVNYSFWLSLIPASSLA
ncbi:carboxylesterase family protein [Legionella impletisoli]|uniref:Carboxylic ester hydrolase n=1 Tax=Legionella impletisoli TaxID=343510 RepID=A0A917JXF9_9GAMM|nr:carboxylesterase family protein [Legionella impletisoli]GGI91105.1 para-nitrobenzyl esterase [Legionella impletisoli]